MSRYWGMNWSPQESVDKHEAMRQGMIAASGLSEEHLESARRVLRTQHADREPTMQNGVADSPALIGGERFQLTESHVNAHGETVLNAYRPLGGGRFEKVRITQAQADRYTRIVSQIKGER